VNYKGPGIYRHYKGGEYRVVGLAAEEATFTPVVIYRPNGEIMPADVKEKTGGVLVSYWTRPLSSFNGDGAVPDAKGLDMTVPRFVYVRGF
jgi:hypothetical protein